MSTYLNRPSVATRSVPDGGVGSANVREYDREEREIRKDHGLAADVPVLFLEVYIPDASDFEADIHVRGVSVDNYHILRVEATAIPNGIAATLLYLRDATGKTPHAYFHWSKGNPFLFLLLYLLSGKGDVAPVTREVLRIAERDPERRPVIHAAM